MALEPEQLGAVGIAVAALGYVSKGLIDLALKKGGDRDHENICTLLAKIESDMRELLRLHRDPESIFANKVTNELLHKIMTDIAVLKRGGDS